MRVVKETLIGHKRIWCEKCIGEDVAGRNIDEVAAHDPEAFPRACDRITSSHDEDERDIREIGLSPQKSAKLPLFGQLGFDHSRRG